MNRKIVYDSRFILGLYLLIGVLVAIQRYSFGPIYYNNFLIFQHSCFHFFEHLNPYPEYPDEYYDVFLYNPSFIILFLPFAYLPTFLGLMLWSAFTTVGYFLGINTLPLSQKTKAFFLYLIIPDLLTSQVTFQTNPLIAAFIVLSVTLLEKEEYARATIFPSLNFFIKVYGAVVGIFFILKNPRLKTLLYLFPAFAMLGVLPLVFYSWSDFATLYGQWFVSLQNDYAINTGMSVMGMVRSLIDSNASIAAIQIFGVVAFLLTFMLILFKKNYEEVKFQLLAYVMIWMVIFNQAAESPTYIIASTGGFIWYLTARKSQWTMILFVFFYLITVLSSSDIFPDYLRDTYVTPYCLKALPCLLIWLQIQYNLIIATSQPSPVLYEQKS